MTLVVETFDLGYRAGSDFELMNVNMHIQRGSVYGFLGPNGAGKTTTIRLLLGLLKPSQGSITIFGKQMPKESVPILAKIGYVPERPHLFPTLTVGEAIDLHASFHAGWDSSWANELTLEFGLSANRKISALSKGESGKLMMLVALAQKPELLVLDEPTDGLDPVVRRDVLQAVLSYVSTHDATVLISSHLIHELERICDWVGVMDRGRMLAELPMEDFKSGIKRIRMASAPPQMVDAPFTLLSRDRMNGSGEDWLVRGWKPSMTEYLAASGAEIKEIIDLDLEDGFVELLRSFRGPLPRE